MSASYDMELSSGRGGREVGVLALSSERYAALYVGVLLDCGVDIGS